MLESAGYVTTEARDGLEALARVGADPPALILLDVHLPGLDGFEVCRRLKADPRTQSIPVLHISAARTTDEDWARGLESGADNYLIAPVSPEVIVGTIRALIHRRRLEQALRADQERALAALRLSERRYRHLIFNAPYGIYTVTPDGRILSANRALAQMLGYESPDELTTLNAETFYQAAADRQVKLSKWRSERRVEATEVRWRTRDGRPLVVRLTGGLFKDAAEAETFEVFVEDLTDQRRLEAERRQAHKMEAIGALAAGIAHDFNNLLTAILGYTDLMLEQIDADKPLHADLQRVREAGQSAAALTKQLLAFGRKQTLRTDVLDLNDVVRTTERLLRRVIGEDVHVVIETAADLRAIRADRVQLEQVLLNLAVNAREAMPGGGTLTIRTSHVDIAEPLPFPKPVQVTAGTYVRVTVTDTGCGMDAATLERVFEPFFTTKQLGRGTGLGLATAYGIVKQLGGYIWVASEPERGSTFSLYFPALDEPVAPVIAADVPSSLPIGRERILVVEDDAPVRTLTTSVLVRHGYRVQAAGSASEALATVAAQTQPFDLVVTDVVMPNVSGPALVRQLRANGPLVAIYMSGYAGPDVTPELTKDDSSFLPKPFTPTGLLHAVRQALDRRRARPEQ